MKQRSFSVYAFGLLALLHLAVLRAQVPSSPEYFSASKKFSGEVSGSGGADGSFLVTVFKREGEAKTHHWSRKMELGDENQSFDPNDLRMTVTDDGNAAILRRRYNLQDRPAIHVVSSSERPVEIFMDEVLDKLPAADDADDDDGAETGQPFEVLSETPAPAVYGLWFPPAGEWVVLALDKPALTLAEGALKARFQSAGLAKARELVRAHQPGALQRVLQPIRQAVQGNFQGFSMPNPSAYIDDETVAAYRFLAAQRLPEDKKFIASLAARSLAETVLVSTYHYGGYSPFNASPVSIFAHSQSRRLGDELLALWDKLPALPKDEFQSSEAQALGRPRLFASVSGQVRLPFPAMPDSGTVLVCLIPDELPKDGWREDPNVVKLSIQRFNGLPSQPGNDAPGASHHIFGFGTLTPGAYRLKAVWDHRAPRFPNRGEDGAPEPGDYESTESPPFRLAAGEFKPNVVLECTNRVGNAPAFFKNDEKWLAENPPRYDEFNSQYPFRPPQRTIHTSSLRGAVLKTNSLELPIQMLRLNVIEQPEWNVGEGARFVTLKFLLRSRRDPKRQAHLTGKIVDEHGCAFEGNASSSSGRFMEIYFNPFPFAAKSYRFDIIETEYITDASGEPKVRTIASFTLTNQVQLKPETLTASALPIRQKLETVAVELASLDPKQLGGQDPFVGGPGPGLPELKFWAGNEQSSVWRLEHISWRDRWGGESQDLGAFCREERTLKLAARVARDFELAEFTPEETWTVPIEKIPGPGDSLPLKLKNEWQGIRIELLAIGGPGEFAYDRGKNTASTKQISTPYRFQGIPPRFGNARVQEPKIYFKNAMGFPMGMPGPERPVEIIARTPHLVYRATTLQNESRFAILDELETARQEGSHYYGQPISRSAPQTHFGSLKHRPGETNAKITIVAQKAREVEFVVARPKRKDTNN